MKTIEVQNLENIRTLYDETCSDFGSKVDTTQPPIQYPDINLIVTINYNSVYKVIPMVEVSFYNTSFKSRG